MSEIYGYVRVSTQEQNEERQLMELEKVGVPFRNIYMDKMSGKNFERPYYLELKRQLCKGDLLYILSIDRLGRNYEEIQKQGIVSAKARGVKFGRPQIEVPEKFYEIVKQCENGEIKYCDGVKQSGMSQSTFYRRLREIRNQKNK